MATKVMTIVFKFFHDMPEGSVAVKSSCQKEGCLYFCLIQYFSNIKASICKFIAGKNKSDLFLCGVSADNSPMIIAQGFFFTAFELSVCLAANR